MYVCVYLCMYMDTLPSVYLLEANHFGRAHTGRYTGRYLVKQLNHGQAKTWIRTCYTTPFAHMATNQNALTHAIMVQRQMLTGIDTCKHV